MKITNIVGNSVARLSTKAKTAVIAGTMSIASMSAMAQDLPDQQPVGESAALGEIFIPIDFTSIATAVATAGATMIGLLAIYQIGFKLVRKFISRAGRMV